MDFKRMMSFFAVAMLILLGWEYLFPTPKPTAATTQSATQQGAPATGAAALKVDAALLQTEPVVVTTDTVKATIDEKSGDLRRLVLLKHNATSDASKEFVLFDDSQSHQYIAQSSLLTPAGEFLLKDVPFSAAQKNYTLNGDAVEVRLSAPETNGVQVDKVYTFRKGSYLIDVRFDVTNKTAQPLQLDAAYRVLRDGSEPDGAGYFDHTYSGPVLYTPEGKFEKVPFKELDKDFTSGREQADYVRKTDTGWVGMSQHYFMATWILQPKGGKTICENGVCQIDIRKRNDGLYSAGVRTTLPAIAADAQLSFPVALYAGPQEYATITQVADNLQLIKDYGKVHLFAAPLFWLLNKLHEFVGNWGWTIVLLTIVIKLVFYPLSAASYRSMAKMKQVTPRLQALREKFGDDRAKLNQAMLIQIPVFISLYWVLLGSVEMRGAPWILWIQDLAARDPYFILPAIMMATMFLQIKLNPTPPDPMQARIMMLMPLVFGGMMFFFPAGLVLYWCVNNIVSIAQQRYIMHKLDKEMAAVHR